MSLDVFLQILRALERLAAEVALVRLQRHVNTDVRSDVVSLDRRGAAVAPLAGQVQVVGALATNVTLTDVILNEVSTCRNAYAVVARLVLRYAQGFERKSDDLRRVAQQKGDARRNFATGRQAGRQKS